MNLLLVEAHAEMTDQEHDVRRTALTRCVEKLPPADRELLAECYRDDGDGNRVHAAAARRNRSSHSVYNSLRRIRRVLFDCINRTIGRRVESGGTERK